ncbi:MAG TPA: cytochrome P450 [Solirubrobacteraceae bacterium]|nr:cytochrome P450 [Solirubrobacteraceae bacterium]
MNGPPSTSPTCPVSHEFDPFGAEFQADPGMSLVGAREHQPVFYSPRLDAYVVTRYHDIRSVFLDTTTFSPRNATVPITPLSAAAQAKLDEYEFRPVKTLGVEEEPVHMRLRKRLTDPFTPARLEQFEPRIRSIWKEYVDAIVTRGRSDLIAEVTTDAPAVVALEFLGVPQEDIAKTKDFAKGIMQFIFGRPTEDEQIRTCDFMGQHQRYSTELVQRLIESPEGEGFLRHCVRAFLDDPTDLDINYLSGLAMNGLAAAHETTSNAAGQALLQLLTHLDIWAELCDEPALIPGAVEETLRIAPSGATWRRQARVDTSIADVEVPAGATVLLVLASGNCDPEMFPEPARFDVRRDNARRHLTFGIGAHRCLGAGLAQLQLKVMLEQLSSRLPHMRLVDAQPVERLGTASVGGPLHLEVEWDPAENPLAEDRP